MSKETARKKLRQFVDREKAKGNSLTQCAVLFEVSEGTLKGLLRGDRPPSIEAGVLIRKHAKIPIPEWVG